MACLATDETLVALESGPDGLDETEASARLRRHGPNRLETTPPARAIRILIAQLESVVVLLLLIATGVAFFIGDPLEAAAIAAVLLINVTLGFVIELRARRAMEGLSASRGVTLGVGLRRMARRRALIRRLPAVEALGSATI
jgi:magnesium-transporting ATPase (P-type)